MLYVGVKKRAKVAVNQQQQQLANRLSDLLLQKNIIKRNEICYCNYFYVARHGKMSIKVRFSLQYEIITEGVVELSPVRVVFFIMCPVCHLAELFPITSGFLHYLLLEDQKLKSGQCSTWDFRY